MMTLTFKPKHTAKNLLVVLPDRARDVVINRFGLGKEAKKRTLESIGREYGVTRERVRQIENFALHTIKKSPAYQEEQEIFEELQNTVNGLGAVVSEQDLFEFFAKDVSTQNHINFLFVLGDTFEHKKEDQHFRHRWVTDNDISQRVHQALHNLYQGFTNDDIIAEQDILSSFEKHLSSIPKEYVKNQDVLRRWLNLSKVVGVNQLGEWGLAGSPNIRARGIRDYAYLIIRKHGSPLHFTEVAKAITQTFGKHAHVATCHNELIKDKDRFVLVGRGLYGLTEWGYSNGIVRDVITRILKEEGSMSKEDITSRILKERYVKENTVFVNLQNKKYFTRDEDGNYMLI